jgi:hypothetical protein
MREESSSARPCRRGPWLAALAAALSASCGSNPSAPPTAPAPYTTRAFVHLLDQEQKVLSTFMVEPQTGDLSLVDTKGAPEVNLAADPLGRSVYLNEKDWLRSFRVDPSSGVLTLSGEAPVSYSGYGVGTFSVLKLVASAEHLYVDGTYRYSVRNTSRYLGVLPVDPSGALPGAGFVLKDKAGTYLEMLAADRTRDVVLAGHRAEGPYQSWSYQVRALVLDAAVADPGYREVATVTFGTYYEHNERPVRAAVAAGGRLVLVRSNGDLLSFVLREEAGTFEQMGLVSRAVGTYNTVRTWPGHQIAFAEPGRLAVVTPERYVHASQTYLMSVALYGVATDGQVSLESTLAKDFYSSVRSMAFHPSGRFLYVCGVPSDGSPWGSVPSTATHLLTFLIDTHGGMTLFRALPVAGCGPMVVTAPPS